MNPIIPAAVLALLQTVVTITVPHHPIVQAGQTRVLVPIQFHVPPHAENAWVEAEVVGEGLEHRSRFPLKGDKEKWLVRWTVTYALGEGPFEVRAVVLRKDWTVRGHAMVKGEVH